MAAVTLTDAARALGFKSRSTLYRLRDAGDLAAYLLPPGPTGRQLIELEPAGLPPLREHVARLVRLQINTPSRAKGPRSDGRWGLGPVRSLRCWPMWADCSCPPERPRRSPRPYRLPWRRPSGKGGLEWLRVALADDGCWRAGPGTPLNPSANREWWGDDGWGRWEPGEPIDDDATFWLHVAGIVAGMLGGPFAELSGRQAAELHWQLQEAIGAVEAGARFDAERWAINSARLILDDPDPASAPELQRLAAGGRLPPELQAQAEAALAAYAAREEAAALMERELGG